jgi:hypothetical protein
MIIETQRDGKNSLCFGEKVCFHLNLVGILVPFFVEKSPFSLLFGLTMFHFFNLGVFFVK